jgi:hypothetical protein
MSRNWTPSIVPTASGDAQTIYLVVNNFRHLGTAFTETDVEQADLETVITDLMSGQYSDPVRVVAFNTAEHWADDVSQDVALEIQRRVDLAGDALPSSIEAFIETHTGPSRQLSLRLNCHGIKSFLIRS